MKNWLLLTLVVLIISCEKSTLDSSVQHAGALRTMMSGDLSARISIDTLNNKKHLYALGAIENLRGEIQIFNGSAVHSKVNNEKVQISYQNDEKAALLVWAQVEEWQEIQIPDRVSNTTDLEKFIKKQTQRLKFAQNQPVVFKLEGIAENLNWHIINWNINDAIHTHKKHQESGLNGRLENQPVEVLGFYSEKHKGIFTHHTSFVHMHFRNRDDSLAGHVDGITLSKNMILKLPKL